ALRNLSQAMATTAPQEQTGNPSSEATFPASSAPLIWRGALAGNCASHACPFQDKAVNRQTSWGSVIQTGVFIPQMNSVHPPDRGWAGTLKVGSAQPAQANSNEGPGSLQSQM